MDHENVREGREPEERWTGLTGGLVLIAVGTVFLLSRLEFLPERTIWLFLPWVVMLGLGAARLWQRRTARRDARFEKAGLTLILIGAWGMVSALGLGGLTWGTSWPLLLIGFGLIALLESLGRRAAS